jgi:hypothetical protein
MVLMGKKGGSEPAKEEPEVDDLEAILEPEPGVTPEPLPPPMPPQRPQTHIPRMEQEPHVVQPPQPPQGGQ